MHGGGRHPALKLLGVGAGRDAFARRVGERERPRVDDGEQDAARGLEGADFAACLAAFLAARGEHGLDIVESAPLEHVAQDDVEADVAVEERLDGDRVAENTGRRQLLANVPDDHRFAGGMNLDPPVAEQTHDPDPAGAGPEELVDLDAQFVFVLPDARLLDGERRCGARPPRAVLDVLDGDVRGAQRLGVHRDAEVDTGAIDVRIGVEDGPAPIRVATAPSRPLGAQRMGCPREIS